MLHVATYDTIASPRMFDQPSELNCTYSTSFSMSSTLFCTRAYSLSRRSPASVFRDGNVYTMPRPSTTQVLNQIFSTSRNGSMHMNMKRAKSSSTFGLTAAVITFLTIDQPPSRCEGGAFAGALGFFCDDASYWRLISFACSLVTFGHLRIGLLGSSRACRWTAARVVPWNSRSHVLHLKHGFLLSVPATRVRNGVQKCSGSGLRLPSLIGAAPSGAVVVRKACIMWRYVEMAV